MTNQRDGWLTIREASLQLGVSELTVRRRIKDGRLAHRLENGKYYVDPSLEVGDVSHRDGNAAAPPLGRGRPTPGSSAASSSNMTAEAAWSPGVTPNANHPKDGWAALMAATELSHNGRPATDQLVEPAGSSAGPDQSSDSMIDQPTGHPVDQSNPPAHSPPAPSLDLDALFAEQVRLAEAAGRARLLEVQLRQAEDRHAELQETVVTLAARNGWLAGKLEEREQEIKLLTDSRHRRPWWKRLLGAPGTGS